MELKFIDFKAEIKAYEGDSGKIIGYASVYDVLDSSNEVVQKGAFTRSLKEYGLPSMLLQHNQSDVIGLWTKAIDDEHGLKLEGQLNLDVQKAKETYSLAKQGALKGLSIGFRTREASYNEQGVRVLEDVDLMETSIVTFPANREAQLTGVKSMPRSEKEFERFLRDAGYSRTQAMTILSEGFRSVRGLRDADESDATEEIIISELKKTLNILQGANENV